MAIVNFREVQNRFTHIDAEFVSCTLGFDGTPSKYTVSFYPWWEHPAFVEAMESGKSWGFASGGDGSMPVTVYPKGLVEFRLTGREQVVDSAFLETHPLLWPYEDRGQIFCNSNPPLAKVVEGIREALPDVPKEGIYSYVDPLLPYEAPFCLGTFPLTLFNVVDNVLADLGVGTFISPRPEAKAMPVLFLIDDSDYIIAEDFDIDVPEFEHRPEWFKPGGAAVGPLKRS